VLGRQYEYEEEIYLLLDGSATIYVHASVAALVALRGLPLDVDPRARLDRDRVRELYDTERGRVTSVTGSRRAGRRFVHIRVNADDIRQLPRAAPFAWSSYTLAREGGLVVFRQQVSGSAGKPVVNVGWTGGEMVAFRAHLPSRIRYHDATRLERGNILLWEQSLAGRWAGAPLQMEARMEPRSILNRTLLLFGATLVVAALTFVIVIWLVMRKGKV
jgi:hypothetical protein